MYLTLVQLIKSPEFFSNFGSIFICIYDKLELTFCFVGFGSGRETGRIQYPSVRTKLARFQGSS